MAHVARVPVSRKVWPTMLLRDVPDRVWRVTAVRTLIHTGPPGSENYVYVDVEPATWADAEAECGEHLPLLVDVEVA